MAERSTAAVDVAGSSAAKAGKATADGSEAGKTQENVVGTHEDDGRAESGETARPDQPAELHSGHKLAGRYRLEECVTRLEGFSSWRAVDEKLRRAVGVHLLPADHPRARSVLAAARSAALLGDPRFVQVLDAVEENDLVYVVHEWLPDATELTAVLAAGPMEPFDAYQLVNQVSQAMAAAHREGLAHLRLGPGSVLRTGSGQYRIRGLAVMAALRGITSDSPQRTDTEAIGALLYAALTQRWPYEGNAHGLAGLPKGVGLIAPDQVRAGVHRGLSQLAMRALTTKGQEQPCTTPEELAKAVAAMPRIRPPETPFTAGPAYHRPQPGGYGPQAAHPAPATPPPPLQSRTGTAIKWIVSSLLIAALGLGSWQLADTLLKRMDKDDDTHHSQSTDGETPKKSPPKQIRITNVAEFSPLTSPTGGRSVPNAADGDPSTAWTTGRFDNFPNFGNLGQRADGSGIVVDLGSVKKISRVEVQMYAGQTVEVLAAAPSASSPASLQDFPQRMSKLKDEGKRLRVNLNKPVKTRYVLVHITKLPPEGPNSYRGGIYEIKVFG